MKRKTVIEIILVIVVAVLLIKTIAVVFIEPWVGRKIVATLDKKSKDYRIEIDKIHISMIHSGIELGDIKIYSKFEQPGNQNFIGEIESIKCKGISIMKAIFKNDIDINEVIFSNSNIMAKIPFAEKTKPKKPIVSPYNIHIGSICFNQIDLAIMDIKTELSYSVEEGMLNMYDLQIANQDSLNPISLDRLDFTAKKLHTVSSDSMYSYNISNIICSSISNTLTIDSFSIQPNYTKYEFTSRHKFQTDRFDARFSNIDMHGFSATTYLISNNLISSYIEIGKMDMDVFRDKRKEFRHVQKPTFQDMIYNYPGNLQIDSIGINGGNITYSEHVEKATKSGKMNFDDVRTKIYNISNDTVYKTKTAYLEFNAEALLMGKGKMNVLLKSKIFDRNNTFSVNGSVSSMEAKELNPMLEKNAFIYVTSGEIDAIHFNFTANNTKATGKMTLLYHGLDVAVKNKQTNDTTAIKERIVSFFANKKLLNSNPLRGEETRTGIIDQERDPERFLFNYSFKSIMTGIKSTLVKSRKERKK